MTLAELERQLNAFGVTSVRVIRVAGEWWAITRFGVGTGHDLAMAATNVLAVVKARLACERRAAS